MQYYSMVQVYNQQYKSDELAVHNQVNQLWQVYLTYFDKCLSIRLLSFLPFSFIMFYRFHGSIAQLMANKFLFTVFTNLRCMNKDAAGKAGAQLWCSRERGKRVDWLQASTNPAQSGE